MRFVDVKNDIAFRKIFGNEGKTEILISFLNAVLKLEGESEIEGVEKLSNNQLPHITGSKATILEVMAKDKAGQSYIVEIKLIKSERLDRSIFFDSASLYSSQLGEYGNVHNLNPVIFIGILDYENNKSPNYFSRHLILDAETQEHKLKDFEFIFIELPKFTKTEQELDSLVDKWVYFIKNAKRLKEIPANVDDEGLRSAYLEAEKHSWTDEELHDYDYARLRETDDVAATLFVLDKVAKKLLKTTLSNEEIAEYTGLTVERVEELRKEV